MDAVPENLVQLRKHQPRNTDAAGADDTNIDNSYILVFSLQAYLRRPEMNGQKTDFFLRHRLLYPLGQDSCRTLTFFINLRIRFPDIFQHRICDLHVIYEPDKCRLQMCQKPLDKLTVLLERIGILLIICVDHAIDQREEFLLLHLHRLLSVPLDILMLGAFQMQTDICRLNLRNLHGKLFGKLLRNLFCQRIIFIAFHLFLPLFRLIHNLIFENTADCD